jgi:hypothetical protein
LEELNEGKMKENVGIEIVKKVLGHLKGLKEQLCL